MRWQRELQALLPGRVFCDEPLARYSSLRIGGPADCLVAPKNEDDLCRVVRFLRERAVPFLPVGNGTNLLVRDGGYRGAVIVLQGLRELTWERGSGDMVTVRAGAGLSLAAVVGLALREGLTGMEFCAGIPGSVGGAVRMNAGAFGRELKDVLASVRLLRESGIEEVTRAQLAFAYRDVALPAGAVITGATFLLRPGMRDKIAAQIDEIMALRKQKHPLELPNVGSIFKNPPGIPAGQLIEELGLKGMQIGGARISEKHGNFIVNMGEAQAADILALIEMVQQQVRQKRGIELETEVRIIGE